MASAGIAPLVLEEQVDPRLHRLKSALLAARDALRDPQRLYGTRVSIERSVEVYFLQTTHKDTWLKLGRLTEENHRQLVKVFEWHYEETQASQIFFSFKKDDKDVWLVTRSADHGHVITYTLSPA
jgi:hypothetical protein